MQRPRLWLPVMVAGLTMLASAPAASAHTQLESSNPADGAQVASAPSQLTLTFSEAVPPQEAQVTVSGPNGTAWQTGTITAQGPTLTVPVQPTGPAGQYTITWRVVSADGDPVGGALLFTLTNPVPAAAPTGIPTSSPASTVPSSTAPPPASSSVAPAAEPGDADGGGIPVWVGILAALAAAAAAIALVRRLSRSGEGTER